MKPVRFLLYALAALILAKTLSILAACASYLPRPAAQRITILMIPKKWRGLIMRGYEVKAP